MKTKEIAFTLPLVVCLFEYSFYPNRGFGERIRFLILYMLALLIVPATRYVIVSGSSTTYNLLEQNIPPYDYFLTQTRVIVTYIRLLLLPVNQMIDYNYSISRTVFNFNVMFSLMLILLIMVVMIYLLVQGGRGKLCRTMRIIGFGGMWFFITLSVESSFIPITDVIFEHRLYLPSVGMFIVMVTGCDGLFFHMKSAYPRSTNPFFMVVAGILVLLPVATYSRNNVWRSEVGLWQDAVKKSPGNARALAIIGTKLIETGNIDQAIIKFQEAIRIKPDYADAYICLGNAYFEKGMFDDSYQYYLKALMLGSIDHESSAQLMMNIGNYYFKKGAFDMAIYYYKNSLSILPNEAATHYNLGQAYKRKGMTNLAVIELEKAHKLNPDRY